MVEFARAALGMFATESVGVRVKVPEESVIFWPMVMPLADTAEEVARVSAPVLAEP